MKAEALVLLHPNVVVSVYVNVVAGPVYGLGTLYDAIVVPGTAAGNPERVIAVPLQPEAPFAVGVFGVF